MPTAWLDWANSSSPAPFSSKSIVRYPTYQSETYALLVRVDGSPTRRVDSLLFRELNISVIPHGLDMQAFQPRDKVAARMALGLASEAKVVLFVAADVGSQRKGLDLLLLLSRSSMVIRIFSCLLLAVVSAYCLPSFLTAMSVK